MALNPLTQIAADESSYGTNLQNPSTTASGVWQDVNGTWTQAITAIGYSPQQYPTALSAPASVQAAANAWLYNQQGFAPWTIGNQTLAADIAANGGPAAYAVPGTLSTNPADYASLNQPGGLTQYFASTGAPGLTVSQMTPAQAAATFGPGGTGTLLPGVNGTNQTAVSSQSGPLDHPFEWAYQQLITSTQQTFNTEITQMQTMVSSYLGPLLALALIATGMRVMLGRYLVDRFAAFVLKVCIVMPFVAIGSYWYQEFVVDPVMYWPTWWQQYIINSTGYQLNTVSPAAMFDHVYLATYATEMKIWAATPWSLHAFWVVLALFTARVIIDLSLAALFLAFAILTFLSLVTLVLGPVCVPFLLFERTAPFFRAWVDVVATLLLAMLAIDIVLVFFMAIMNNLMQALQVTGTPQTDVPGFWGCAIVMAMMGWSVRYVPRLVERIGSGVIVSLDSASYHMSGGAVRDAAMVPVRVARRWAGI